MRIVDITSTCSGRLGALIRCIRVAFGDRGGNVAMTAAILALPLIGAMGLAIDYSRASAARADVQGALDAAVLAGATDATANWTGVAASTFTAMKKTEASGAPSFTLDSSGQYVGSYSGTLTTTFAALLSSSPFTLTASATAVRKSGDKVCILLLNTAATPGLLLNSGATLTAPTCQVDVKSTGTPAVIFNSGTTFTTKKTCVAGANLIDNGGSHAALAKTCTTTSDPFAGTLPTPSSSACGYWGVNVNGGSYTASPGVYCGGMNFNGAPSVTFQPGVYVIKGGNLNVNGGTWSGSGVTFYFADTSYIQFNSSVKLTLSAPTSGSYANLLIYEASGLSKSGFSINATNGATLAGLIYLPSRQLTLNSGANVSSQNLTLVLDTLVMNTVNWSLESSSKPIYGAGGGSGVYLKN